MYDLHQSLEGGVKPRNSNSLEATLRELREETDLRIHQLQTKWIGNDSKFDCDIYAIELDIRENPQWTEQNKMELWGIILWDIYINITVSRLLTPTHYTYIEIFLKEVGIISTKVNVTFNEYEEVCQYDPEDAPNELGINENWEPQNQVTIN